MTSISQIKDAIIRLPEGEVHALREWLEELEAQLWDDEIERDMKAGKWDATMRNAQEEYDAGRCTDV